MLVPQRGSSCHHYCSDLQSGIPIARIEFLDDISIEVCNQFSGLDHPVAPATLFLEFAGSPVEVEQQLKVVGTWICKDLQQAK